ncbi:hypothetical protein [Microcoleus sp. AR_TQ3_B6]|uniref:hypothetical protein n=1 Tax=Microcoleus sp. AR_TQ3_B6 TaxID=3055284 RepID=UPI002FD6C43B
MGRLLGLRDCMQRGRSSSRASPTGDRSLCATYHILEGAYNPESENRPKSAMFQIAVAASNPSLTAPIPLKTTQQQPNNPQLEFSL